MNKIDLGRSDYNEALFTTHGKFKKNGSNFILDIQDNFQDNIKKLETLNDKQ